MTERSSDHDELIATAETILQALRLEFSARRKFEPVLRAVVVCPGEGSDDVLFVITADEATEEASREHLRLQIARCSRENPAYGFIYIDATGHSLGVSATCAACGIVHGWIAPIAYDPPVLGEFKRMEPRRPPARPERLRRLLDLPAFRDDDEVLN